jgi:hypothetical protein
MERREGEFVGVGVEKLIGILFLRDQLGKKETRKKSGGLRRAAGSRKLA